LIQCFVKRNFTYSFSKNTVPWLLSASNIHLDYAHHARVLHKHDDFFELLFVRSGSSTYVVENNYYEIKKGDIIICNSGVLHDEVVEKNDNICSYSLAIDNLQLEGLPKNHLIPNNANPIVHVGEYFEAFNVNLGTIFDLLSSNVEGVEESCHFLMMSVLTLLIEMIKKNENNKVPKIDDSTLGMRIRKYIDVNYSENLTLQSIGDIFYINPYYLSHLFKKQTGYSPLNYIIRRRIGEAQSLLITTNRSIMDISTAVGFNNINNFNIHFMKCVGLSPSIYRKTYTLMQ
jgi:AraC-like DNA-binding protein